MVESQKQPAVVVNLSCLSWTVGRRAQLVHVRKTRGVVASILFLFTTCVLPVTPTRCNLKSTMPVFHGWV
jgi:hypothetical protein